MTPRFLAWKMRKMVINQGTEQKERHRALLLCVDLFLFLFLFWRGDRRKDKKERSWTRREDVKLGLLSAKETPNWRCPRGPGCTGIVHGKEVSV